MGAVLSISAVHSSELSSSMSGVVASTSAPAEMSRSTDTGETSAFTEFFYLPHGGDVT